MLSCAFFGQDLNYGAFIDKTRKIIEELIDRGVTEFYTIYNSRFDYMCVNIVSKLREKIHK